MTKNLPTPISNAALPATVGEKVKRYAKASRSKATVRSYRTSARVFAAWCEAHGRDPLPASVATVGAFLADNAERYRPSTLAKIMTGVAHAHRLAGHPFDWDTINPKSEDPADRIPVSEVMRGIRNEHGVAPKRVDALKADELRAVVASLPESLQGIRDRALLLVGFAGALRRSELVGLDIGTPAVGSTGRIEFAPEGLRITLAKSKTDQEGKGLIKGIPRTSNGLCAVSAVEAWLAAAQIGDGPVFRPIDKGGRVGAPIATEREGDRLSDRAVAKIIKRAVARAMTARILWGVTNPTLQQIDDAKRKGMERAEKVSGHSLRAGFATSAAAANITGENMAKHVGWKSAQMATTYIREAELFKSNPLHVILKDD